MKSITKFVMILALGLYCNFSIAQDAAADPQEQIKSIQDEMREKGRELSKLKSQALKENEALNESVKAKQQQIRELNDQINDEISAASPEVKKAFEELDALRAEIKTIQKQARDASNAAKKKKDKK